MALPLQKAIRRPPSSSFSTSQPIPNLPIITSIASILQTANSEKNSHCEEALKQFSPHLTPTLVLNVIKNLKNPHHALLFFNWASKPKPNPTNYSHPPSCYTAITDLLISHSLFSSAFSLLSHSGKLSDFHVSKFITALGQRGDIRGAIHWFHKAKSVAKGRYLFSCNALLAVLVKANRVKLAHSIYNQFVAEAFAEPDVYTHTIMIRGFCKVGMVESACKVFDEMRCDPTMVTYNTLIHGLCRKGDMDGARRVFDQMVGSKSCKPNVVTFSSLIDGYSKKGEFQEALHCMEDMAENFGCFPNVVTYNALIEGLCLSGHVDEAKRMMTKMRLNGVKDNCATNTSILKGYCVVGKSDDAIKHLNEMVSRGMNPDVKAYGVIVNEYCRIGKPSEGVSLLREMVARGIKPSASSFNAVFRAFVCEGKLEEAVFLLKEMPRMRCSPNFLSYSIVVCGLSKVKGRMQQVEELVGDMIRNGHKLDATMYNCLVWGYCEDGDEEMALKTVYDLIDNSFVINHDTFCSLVKELCAKGKAKEAEIVFDEMCRRCPLSNVSAYKMVLCQLGGKADATEEH